MKNGNFADETDQPEEIVCEDKVQDTMDVIGHGTQRDAFSKETSLMI